MNPRPRACHALLVDFDGVLRAWPVDDLHIEPSCGLPAGSIREAAFEPALLTSVVTGRISDETWRQELAAALSLRFPLAQVATAVERWSSPAGAIDDRVLEVLAAARERARLVLVTNATSRLGSDLATLGLGNFFHAVANSSDIGVAKPNPAMFETALSLAGTSAEHALFVDDSSRNVAEAKRLGIRSCLFQGPASLHAFLRSNGVLPEPG